ncbi:Fe(3+) ABC transporter substrate-binding protein [Paenibacillus senegalensis]|uniref:Fe(3+) ABC transporter substrate-binding protein n=1 Tax=Paenibacillus senegalensis TaxID=1465766 RepID=UPI0002897E2C|nr:Fe(3+) ABC transporter substrate-binding protein [Paenibacillus senegalensis]
MHVRLAWKAARLWLMLLWLMLAGVLAGCSLSSAGQEAVLKVYTSRHYEVDSRLYEAFTEQTGIRIEEVKGTAEELLERIIAEGEQTTADLFVSVDGGVLEQAKAHQLFQAIESAVWEEQVPERWRDDESYWTAISSRARVIVYAKDRVDPAELTSYQNLADPNWKGRLLIRSSANGYNQSLLASLAALNGLQDTLDWAAGVARNLARSPEGGDRAQLKGLLEGAGDVALVNTYYLAGLLGSDDMDVARETAGLGVVFPDQKEDEWGTHVNISGIGLIRHSGNKEAAVQLIEFLTGSEAQTRLAHDNFEYPVNPEASMPDILSEWSEFKAQPVSFSEWEAYRPQLADVAEISGWD